MNNIIGVLIIIAFVTGFAIGLGAKKHANKIDCRVGYGGLERIDSSQDTVYINCSKDEKETTLKDRVSKLEKRLHGLDVQAALEKEGIKEGSIISNMKRSLYTNFDHTGIFIIIECSWETLKNDEIVVENSAHESQIIDTWGIGLAEDKDKKEFIQNYNEYAEGLKIKESK